MKIAVASQNEMVADHFGHCENFNIYDVSDGKVVSGESIPNPGHKPGFLPNEFPSLFINRFFHT